MEFLTAVGMDADMLTDTLKAVKASNSNIGSAGDHMRNVRETVQRLAEDAGVDARGIEHALDALDGYAQYGFNKSHAVAYARIAFMTAWLAIHHPAAWWAAVMSWCDTKHVDPNYKAMKRAGVATYPAHINESTLLWTPVKSGRSKAVRRGLLSIDGIGEKVAQEIVEHAPYTSIADFVERTNNRVITGKREWLKRKDLAEANGVMGRLYEAGAFEGVEQE